MSKIYLETDRIIFRDWKAEDCAAFARMNNDPLIMEYFPRSLTEGDSDKLVKKFQKHIDKHGYGFYALERKEDGAFMGFTGVQTVPAKMPFSSAKNPAIEIAWRLDYEYWGKGYGSEAAQAVLDHGFAQLKLDEVTAYCVFDNTRAIKLMEKIGMTAVDDGAFQYPGLAKDHPLGAFALYKITQ